MDISISGSIHFVKLDFFDAGIIKLYESFDHSKIRCQYPEQRIFLYARRIYPGALFRALQRSRVFVSTFSNTRNTKHPLSARNTPKTQEFGPILAKTQGFQLILACLSKCYQKHHESFLTVGCCFSVNKSANRALSGAATGIFTKSGNFQCLKQGKS